MKNKLLTILLFSIIIRVSAQNPTGETFENHLKSSLLSYYKNYPQEKVFVQTNQPFYTNSETIWYKVYTMAYGKPSDLSKIIYVQLSDTAGNIITQNKLQLINGLAHGNIDIGQKVKTGWYMLRGFTSWIMNFGPQYYYNQRIYIRNLADPLEPNKNQVITSKYHINFYPEGGDLINNALETIAFKAYSDDGLPAKVEGVIKDNTGKKIADLSTIHDGMGEFTLEVLNGNTYTASVVFPDGSKQEVKLPAAKETGIYLQASQTVNTIQLKLAFAGPEQKFANCVLAASQNSGQVVTYPLQLIKGTNVFELKKEVFTTGIVRLTVFDHDGVPQAERVLFVNNHDLQAPILRTDTLSVAARDRNSFSVMVKDKAGVPVKGNFSIAVTDADAFDESVPSQNIFSALLVSPELQGDIHDAGYYFKNQDDTLSRQLDLVMLTNGWRHFEWKKILNNEKFALNYPLERSQYIAGKVINYKPPITDKDKTDIKLLIMNADSTKFVGSVTPDNAGRFILKDFNHSGLSDIYLETADKKTKAPKLQVKMLTTLDDSLKRVKASPFIDRRIVNFSPYYISGAESETNYRMKVNGILLNAIDVKEKTKTPTQKLIDEHVSRRFVMDHEFTLDLINNPTLNIGLLDYMRGRFPGLQIYGDGPSAKFVYRGGNTLEGTTSPKPPPPSPGKSNASSQKGAVAVAGNSNFLPYFYLDEALVSFGAVEGIQLSDVALIRFMPPPIYFAPYNGGNQGAIMIYTKIPSDDIRKMAGISEFDHYIFNGYSITREFNAPDYKKPAHVISTDNRTTLYWNHDVNTDKNGMLKFGFYNTDRTNNFKVIIQGMDAEGRMTYLEQLVK